MAPKIRNSWLKYYLSLVHNIMLMYIKGCKYYQGYIQVPYKFTLTHDLWASQVELPPVSFDDVYFLPFSFHWFNFLPFFFKAHSYDYSAQKTVASFHCIQWRHHCISLYPQTTASMTAPFFTIFSTTHNLHKRHFYWPPELS